MSRVRIFLGIVLLIVSSLQWGFFEGKIYALGKNNGSPVKIVIPLIYLLISTILYSLGIFSAPINLGLWVALWEVGALVAALLASTSTDWYVWNEAVFVGWVFLVLGIVLLTLGWDLLYGEYITR